MHSAAPSQLRTELEKTTMEKISSSIEKQEDPEKIEEEEEESIITTTTTTTVSSTSRRCAYLLLKLIFTRFLFKLISQAIYSRPWKDLPHHLLELFLNPISEPLDRPYLNRVCKAWQDLKPPPRLCFPALVYGPTISNFIIKGGVGVGVGGGECAQTCVGSSQGWLIIRIRKVYRSINVYEENYSEYLLYLLNIYTKDTIQLPILQHYPLKPQICLSSSPTDPDCIAVMFDITFNGEFLFTKRGWNKWIKSDCKYPNCFSKPAEKYNYIFHVFLFQRKFYGCTIFGNIVAIDINNVSSSLDHHHGNNPTAAVPPKKMTSLTVLPVEKLVPKGSKQIDCNWTFSITLGYTEGCHDWFLIESLGKLLAVRMYRREINKEIINLDVHELDFKTMSWIKVKNLPGDQVLFLSLFSSFSISGSEIGIGSSGGGQGNCIYVSDHNPGKIYKYDMHNQEMMVCTGYGYPPKIIHLSLEYLRFWVKPTFV